jgi:hypothetical protein
MQVQALRIDVSRQFRQQLPPATLEILRRYSCDRSTL